MAAVMVLMSHGAGGLYFYAGMLSGRHGPLAGWITGYMNVFGQVKAFSACQEHEHEHPRAP